MTSALAALLQDPNLSPAFRRVFAAEPKTDYLTVAHEKAAPRRFTGAPLTDFGGLSEERRREILDEETACQREDERREQRERGE